MGKQLITIGVGGSLTSLQMKKDAGLDLRKFGPAAIVRSTEIEWDEAQQKWFIRFQQGTRKNTNCTLQDLDDTDVSLRLHQATGGEAGTLYFDEYDDAIRVEVAVIQAMRKLFGREHV